MAKASIHGLMVVGIKDSMKEIRKMVSEHTNGQTKEFTKECGKMENNMVKENIFQLKVKLNLDYGNRARG